jgi:Flp pilus assembly protein TadG
MSSSFWRFAGRFNSAVTGFQIECHSLARFNADERGTVAMVFGLTTMVLVLCMGASVDMGRWLHAHSQTRAAVDSAVLAGSRTLQVTGGDTAAALSAARAYYVANTKHRPKLQSDKIDFVVDAAHKAVTATGTAYIETPFLRVASVTRLALWKDGAAESSSATSEVGSGTGEIEIAIMLDTTGSMGGQKLADLKTAAKDLLEIVLPQGQSSVRVAIAPFAESVRPGSYLSRVRGSKPASIKVRDLSGSLRTYSLTSCVSERTGPDAYTDASPDSTSVVSPVYTRTGSCTPGAALVPLTTDKSRLVATVDSLTASGSTAGHIGTAWAWYLLSPKWANVWGGASAPAAYGDGKVRKIAILMTDGEYNIQYDANGIMTSSTGAAAVNGTSDVQARRTCGAMKEQGIEVYTVGFGLDTANAIETLQECASNDGTAYLAQDGAQLRNAFRDIAIKLSPLHLTN